MNRSPMTRPTFALLAVAIALGACGPSNSPTSSAPAKPAGLPPTLFLAAAPASPVEIKDAKQSAHEGDGIVLRGVIGGSKDPFVDGRAVLTLVDARVKACGENPEDKCDTPWDYCCEPREVLTTNSATVQVVGADGKPLASGLRDVHGLAPLKHITVVGSVARRDEQGTFIVNATGVYVEN